MKTRKPPFTEATDGTSALALALLAVGLSGLLLAACGGGDSEAAPQMFDADGNPVAEGAGESSRSEFAAPDFEIALFENDNHGQGETFRLSDAQGRPVILNFWFPSCPPCVAEMPDIDAAFKAHKSDGIEVVGIQLVGLDTGPSH